MIFGSLWKIVSGALTPVKSDMPVNIPGSVVIENTASFGAEKVIADASQVLTAQQCRNTLITNLGQAANNAPTLPVCATGLRARVIIEADGVGYFRLLANAGNPVKLNGIWLYNGAYVEYKIPRAGDFFDIEAVYENAAWGWKITEGKGTLSPPEAKILSAFTPANDTDLDNLAEHYGATWDVVSGTWDIDTNRATVTGEVNKFATISHPESDDVKIRCTVRFANADYENAAVLFRYQDVQNYWAAQIVGRFNAADTNLFRIIKRVSNVQTVVDSVAFAPASDTNYEISIDVAGENAFAYVDNSYRLAAGGVHTGRRVSGIAIPSVLSPTAGDVLFDNFEVRQNASDFTEVSATEDLYTGTGATDWLGRPYLCEHENKWIMVYRQGAQHIVDVNAVLHIRFSDDEGQTWSDADKLLDGTAVVGFPIAGHTADPKKPAIVAAPNGDLLVQTKEELADGTPNDTYQWRSVDGGKSWTDEGAIGADVNDVGGDDVLIVGQDIFVTLARYDAGPPVTYTPQLYKSSDNGATWAKVSDIATAGYGETGITYLGGSTMLAILRDLANVATFSAISMDMGATWETPVDITPQVGVIQRAILRRIGEYLYLFGRTYWATNFVTTVIRSLDGRTWSRPYFCDWGGYTDGAYCTALERSNGDIYVSSYSGVYAAGEASLSEFVLRPK